MLLRFPIDTKCNSTFLTESCKRLQDNMLLKKNGKIYSIAGWDVTRQDTSKNFQRFLRNVGLPDYDHFSHTCSSRRLRAPEGILFGDRVFFPGLVGVLLHVTYVSYSNRNRKVACDFALNSQTSPGPPQHRPIYANYVFSTFCSHIKFV